MQLEVFPDQISLRRVDPSRNMNRYYRMVVHRDLFGGATLIREWGRVGSPGQIRKEYHVDEGRAVDALADVMLKKRKRGYRI